MNLMSSSALESALVDLQLSDYESLVQLTAVVYDYVLTFSVEVEYVWTKPWTWVSTLFVLVRYAGLFQLVINSLIGNSFIPGMGKPYVYMLPSWSFFHSVVYIYYINRQCEDMSMLSKWSFVLFLSGADIVMILRVWAMYNRSRLILYLLIALFALEIIPTIVYYAIFSDPKNLTERVIRILSMQLCDVPKVSPNWRWMAHIFTRLLPLLRMANGAALCILAIAQSIRQSLQMYRLREQWQINRYMNLLVQQGVFYFLGIFLFNFVQVLTVFGQNLLAGGWRMVLLGILQYVPVYTLAPRLILSMRVLYSHNVQYQRGNGMDSGFGLSSGVGGNGMVFANVDEEEELAEMPSLRERD